MKRVVAANKREYGASIDGGNNEISFEVYTTYVSFQLYDTDE